MNQAKEDADLLWVSILNTRSIQTALEDMQGAAKAKVFAQGWIVTATRN